MLNVSLDGLSGRFRDSVSRRHALRLGGTGALAGLSLPTLLELEAKAASPNGAQAKSCIMIFLEGGPSHIDMWDLKPQAPKEVRGSFHPIATNVPGTRIGNILPRCARVADKFTILRSHSHRDNGHQTGRHWCLTGYKPRFGDGQAQGTPWNELFPSIGSIIARELGRNGDVPPYISVPEPMGPGGPGFYGAGYAPFTIETDPVQPDFKVRDLSLAAGTSRRRFDLRRRLLAGVEKLSGDTAVRGRARTMSTYYQKALELVTSPAARRAFDIQSESPSVRERYGLTSLGQCALLSRRLVEAGCRFVGISHGSWDTHVDNFTSHEKALAPSADAALSSLLADLDERGMLDETMVVMWGEMGRTPRINANAGRDHWSMCQSVIMAGGGIKRGAVVGASDKTASYPTTTPHGVRDLLRTILGQMGVDCDRRYFTPLGRPVPLVKDGAFIDELV
ncbi:MAG: hypothetical protein CMJ65_16525 [Planctomycetaceae bacterium]|jgi:hypothetical protein|nr:hypothetical protein [Planctomycetaceae bacterium]MDP7274888.1 DUF1501 domain-containing protein [Planctomycetaceae bacterium]